jgi:hypothetical protein
MAAFNLEEAARQGRSEMIPAAWTKFPASRGAIWFNFITYTIGGLFVLGLAVYLFVTGSLPGDSSGEGGLEPFEVLAFLIFGCLFLAVGLRMIPSLLKSDQYFFLITGEGFVYVAGKELAGLPFTEISSAYRQTGWLGGKLVVRQNVGKALVLPLGRLFTTRAVREMEEGLLAALQPANKSKRANRA